MSRKTSNRSRERLTTPDAAPQAATAVKPAARAPARSRNDTPQRQDISWLAALAALVIPLLVFARTTAFTFVNWDDDKHILKDQWMYPAPDIGHFWSQAFQNLYIPVSYTFWAILSGIARTGAPVTISGFPHVYDLNPAVFHGATLTLHALNAVLVFFLLRRFVKHDAACAAGALLFGIHPLQVESVAWISETRGTLSTLFALLAALAYFRAADPAGRATAARRNSASDDTTRYAWLAAATALFVMALLCKPNVVIVPVLVFVLDFLLLKRPVTQSAPVLGVWVVIAGIIVATTQTAQPIPKELLPTESHGLITASAALSFYFDKLFLPIKLGPDYGWTPLWLSHQKWPPFTLLFSAAVIAAIAFTWKRLPYVAAGLLLFAGALLPVLGLVPFGYQVYSTVADRYAYVAMLGPALILAWLLSLRPSPIGFAIAGVWLVVLAGLSFQQSAIWQNSYTLFKYSINLNPRSFVSYCNLGTALENDGKHDEAIAAMLQSIKLKPTYKEAYKNLGAIYCTKGQPMDAVPVFQKAEQLDENDAETHNSLAAAYGMENKFQESRDEFEAALRLKPDLESAWGNLAFTDTEFGAWQDASDAATKAVALDPSDPNAQYVLYRALTKLGHTDDAAPHLATAQRLDPALIAQRVAEDSRKEAMAAQAQQAAAQPPPPAPSTDPAGRAYNQGMALDSAGNLAGAVVAYRQALAARPQYAEAMANLGLDLGKQGNLPAAATYLQQAVTLRPDLASAHANLGVVLFAQGKAAQAEQEFRTDLKFNPNDVGALCNLAVILGNEGKKTEAIDDLYRVLQLQPNNATAKTELAKLQ
ncbi:MAG: tetratricopeptide repeat protein [Capsulimonadaceae bacterium]